MKWIPHPFGGFKTADIVELDIGESLPNWISRTDIVHLGDRELADIGLRFSWMYRYYLVQGHHVIVKQKIDRGNDNDIVDEKGDKQE